MRLVQEKEGQINMNESINRFLRYVKVDTQSNDTSLSTPSEEKELNLSRMLLDELEDMGIKGEIDEYGRLYAHLRGEEGYSAIGLNSHVDTALECSGKDVKPQIIHSYDGGIIHLNDVISMSPEDFPSLNEHIGDDLIVTSGDTLLGGDDKAGVAIIMSALSYFVSHPEIKHHPISILFTPDEEIGRGPEHFDKERFGADFAYTIDGDYVDEIAIETFNASHADITIHGISIHPGEAKGKMVNAARLMGEFDALLSPDDRPELTEGHEGFNHLVSASGTVDEAKMHYIIRNHSQAKLEEQKKQFIEAKDALKKKYPNISIDLAIEDDYRNMLEVLEKDDRAIAHAEKAYASLGIAPKHSPIRGGTDGASFSFLGCPTPNLGTGSYNHHGRYEYLSVRDFSKMIEIVIALLKI